MRHGAGRARDDWTAVLGVEVRDLLFDERPSDDVTLVAHRLIEATRRQLLLALRPCRRRRE